MKSKVKSIGVHHIPRMVKSLDKREYDQLDSLSSSANPEMSRLSVIVKNLKDRIESLERNQTELMDKLNALERKE